MPSKVTGSDLPPQWAPKHTLAKRIWGNGGEEITKEKSRNPETPRIGARKREELEKDDASMFTDRLTANIALAVLPDRPYLQRTRRQKTNRSRAELKAQPVCSCSVHVLASVKLAYHPRSSLPRPESYPSLVMSRDRKSIKSINSSTYSSGSKSTSTATKVAPGAAPKRSVREMGGESSGTADEPTDCSAESDKARREENAKARKRRDGPRESKRKEKRARV